MAIERILVLACSKKLGHRCVAGISLETGQWVRPVSTADGGALSTYHCGVDGRYPALREVVRFETQAACPLPAQPENVLVGAGPWTFERQLTHSEAGAIIDDHLAEGPGLLGSQSQTVSVAAVLAKPLAASLAVVEPDDLEFEREAVPWGNGSRTWAQLWRGDEYHAVRLTDVIVRPQLLKQEPGSYKLENLGIKPPPRVVVTVSLGEAFNGMHYKLAAAVVGLA
jgi:hypothetical protein